MPRPKSYIRSEAVEKARDAFWQHGYNALGVRAIEENTGINRFTIQTEFGGKQGLFLEALDNYVELSLVTIITPLSQGGLNAIRHFFSSLVTPQNHDTRDFGCLMVNTVVENASLGNAELKKRTDAHYQRMLNALESALQVARQQGEVDADFDVEQSASLLLALAMGMQVYNRMNGSVSAAAHQANAALKIIDTWQR